MLASSVWRCYALTLLLTTISCISRPNQTMETARGSFLVQVTPGLRRIRREGVIHELTEDDKKKIVDLHNDYRRKEGASNMKKLKWNDYLAEMAADHAKACDFHGGDPERDEKTKPYKKLKQLRFAQSIDNGLPDSIDHHMLEKKFYDKDTGGCHEGDDCSNYFQIVFASTEEVGCAYTKCDNLKSFGSNSFFYVCYYGPGKVGNIIYLNGSSCSACLPYQWCDEGLCVRECTGLGSKCVCGSACQHCGTVNKTSCTCKCADGYSGPDCSESVPGAAVVACAVDRIAPAYDSPNRSSRLVKISLQHLLIIEILLLLCLHNNQFTS